jgi:hypothetical protein
MARRLNDRTGETEVIGNKIPGLGGRTEGSDENQSCRNGLNILE